MRIRRSRSHACPGAAMKKQNHQQESNFESSLCTPMFKLLIYFGRDNRPDGTTRNRGILVLLSLWVHRTFNNLRYGIPGQGFESRPVLLRDRQEITMPDCGAACQAAWRLATATRADWQSARRLTTCPTPSRLGLRPGMAIS